MNKHHTESNKIIDDKIKGVEASLASKGTGNTPKITEIKEGILGNKLLKGKMEGKNLRQTYVILLRMVINIQQMSLVE